jgi:hypothetical protein
VRIDQEIQQTKEKLAEERRIRRQLAGTRRSLVKERQALKQLEDQLQKEQRDVEKLEGLSLTGLFYTVLGSKEEQEQKERQEHLAARLKYARRQYSVNALLAETADLQTRLEQLAGIEQRYEALLKQKEDLLAGQPDSAQQLLLLSDKIAEVRLMRREFAEAIQAGEQAISGLKRVRDAMQSASSWGVWDMLGGGLIATAVKHSRIDDARAEAYQVQELLRRFRRELADIDALSREVLTGIDGFETFADFFLDGLIFDWIVQSKIDRSLQNTRQMIDKVHTLLRELNSQRTSIDDRLMQMEAEKRGLIESGSLSTGSTGAAAKPGSDQLQQKDLL